MQPLRDLLHMPTALHKYLGATPEEKSWTCPTCGPIAPLAFAGGYIRQRCSCEQQAEEQRQREEQRRVLRDAQHRHTYCWLGRESALSLQAKTFATFHHERAPAAWASTVEFAQQPQGTLVLCGPVGTGKTHLLAAIANEQARSGRRCLFASCVQLFDAIQDRIQREQDYHGLLRQMSETPLLLLDDVDKLKPSAFREEILYRLLNERTLTSHALALSCNRSPWELEPWVGAAGLSRLFLDLTSLELAGQDYRIGARTPKKGG